MGIGVNDGLGVAYDRDMALPEDQVSALQLFRFRQSPSQRLFLHVAVARTANTRGIERDLHQPGAIDAEAGLAAPQIRGAGKAFRDRDEIAFADLERAEM